MGDVPYTPSLPLVQAQDAIISGQMVLTQFFWMDRDVPVDTRRSLVRTRVTYWVCMYIQAVT